MKFGKHIQKRQLDIPEYAASFVDYKALKKLIKKLSATPVIPPLSEAGRDALPLDPQASLQANKATFFFRLERELEKVNTFYLQKEAELKLRLNTLLEKKRLMQSQPTSTSRLSSRYIALEEGFRQFSSDLNKLQQFVEVNQTAFSKILKKWDKTSKSRTKELYLSRAVEVQPCFNRDVISDLSDQATTNLLDFEGWAEGERIQFTTSTERSAGSLQQEADDAELDSQILQALSVGNLPAVQDWVNRISLLPDADGRISRLFLSVVETAPEACLELLYNTGRVNISQVDEINLRSILHRAAISGRKIPLKIGLAGGADAKALDIYGRIPLHYACTHGRVGMIQELLKAGPGTIDYKDLDNFTPLIHAIEHSQLDAVECLLSCEARIDAIGEADHVPLNLACQHASIPIVELLLKKRPSIVPDAEGLYPQHLVARSTGSPQLLLMLRDHGADLDQADKLYQWTPLFHASSEGNVECLKTLIHCGVNPYILDEKGLSALYYATWEGHLECMKLLASLARERSTTKQDPMTSKPTLQAQGPTASTPAPMAMEADTIPPISLPPPIIPVKRYGHNFLESKTYVIINFGSTASDSILFYDGAKYPAARLTISSKSADLIPRNLLLPIQDDSKTISFQIDNLDSFSLDFDVYPTFGAKVIARTIASSKVFTCSASTGHWHLELLDPRLRAIGRISFNYQVVRPFNGIPLEITHFKTYWKATQVESHLSALITGSSLSGDYLRLYVQMTSDGVAVLYPRWKVSHYGIDVPVNGLTHEQFTSVAEMQGAGAAALQAASATSPDDIPRIHEILAQSFATLRDALAMLPPDIHVELHVLYPGKAEEERLRLGASANINDFADVLLAVVFEHARHMRKRTDGFVRSIVFSSRNPELCTALNWKQPNYPVLLCNDLGVEDIQPATSGSTDIASSSNGGRASVSLKEAVQTAQSNNFMGLICSSRLLDLAPGLIEAIKTAGLVLIADVSNTSASIAAGKVGVGMGMGFGARTPEGIDGFLRGNGVLKFNDSVDV